MSCSTCISNSLHTILPVGIRNRKQFFQLLNIKWALPSFKVMVYSSICHHFIISWGYDLWPPTPPNWEHKGVTALAQWPLHSLSAQLYLIEWGQLQFPVKPGVWELLLYRQKIVKGSKCWIRAAAPSSTGLLGGPEVGSPPVIKWLYFQGYARAL